MPFTRVDAQVLAALDQTGSAYELVDVSGADRAYYDLLDRLWRAGETFAVVEHDIVVHPTALTELEACPGDWCGFPHPYPTGIPGQFTPQYGLGCVKFTAQLLARRPDAMTRVGVMSDPRHPQRHWCRLDAWLQGAVLPYAGEHQCRHRRLLRHLGRGSSHGCI